MNTALSRRRFICISAAAVAMPSPGHSASWQGFALGADVSLKLKASPSLAQKAIQQTQEQLRSIEAMFSIYDPKSLISNLNRTGTLHQPPQALTQILQLCTRMYETTDGIFDPTVQVLWQAATQNADMDRARTKVGWERVSVGETITLDKHQAITLNGIAQGFATDLIRSNLTDLGLTRALVNIGEFAAIGGPFQMGLADHHGQVFSSQPLSDSALASSSPDAMLLAGRSHIIHPHQQRGAYWSTVCVQADTAAIADAASTAFTLMPTPKIRSTMRRIPELKRVILRGAGGKVKVLE